MGCNLPEKEEKIIKSKHRVQKHGEVFTPKKIVNMMLDQPGIKEACEDIDATFLEPSAGEGAFLIQILERKLKMVKERYNNSFAQYENYSLFALATLYGVELLEDNAQRCVMNMYKVFNDFYWQVAEQYGKSTRDKIFHAAQFIISMNIVQGNFLTQEQADGQPIIFSEWRRIKTGKTQKTIMVQRTDYSLEEISQGVNHDSGHIFNNTIIEENNQLSLFDFYDDELVEDNKIYKYIPCKIENVYLEELEEVNGTNTN